MRLGLADPQEYRDSCGFGLVAQIEGKASHRLLESAIHALACMTHRGGINADGKTGDGCGLLMQKPDGFLRAVARESFECALAELYAAGNVFLNAEAGKAARARDALNERLQEQGLEPVGWREVPTDPSVLGEIALSNLPRFEQVFVNAPAGLSEAEFNVRLFVARRRAELDIGDEDTLYVTALSSKVIGYKGLMMPADLPAFYLDLTDSRMETAICTFHQRFSTNTLPRWPLAQPFRLLAHNGEINTIQGNRNWVQARTARMRSQTLTDIESITPLVNTSGSDSSSMDNMLELLISGGVGLYRAIRMMIPPAWQNAETIDTDLRAFYEFNSLIMEAWDGPAGVVLTDGTHAVCVLDRNGLRPARWVATEDGFITVASEAGVIEYPVDKVVAKGRVGPGEILSVDTLAGKILHTKEVDHLLKAAHPYKRWLREHSVHIESKLVEEDLELAYLDPSERETYMKMFQVTREERDLSLRALAETGQEATGSMGDDIPMAVLSAKVRSPFDYFRQQFAQVTNPAIDSLREGVVMSLETAIGGERNLFQETPEHAAQIMLTSPILSPAKFSKLLQLKHPAFRLARLELSHSAEGRLNAALDQLVADAQAAVRAGANILVLSDRGLAQDRLPVHALFAVGAVHHALTESGLRCDASLVVETATARDPHQMAVLVGFGATAVYPYLGYEVINQLVADGTILSDVEEARKNYRKGLNKGLLKILSKMGISTIASYRGAQLFEAVGVARSVIDRCFVGVTSRIEGADFDDFEADQRQLAARAFQRSKALEPGGLHRFIHGQEYHAFNPDVIGTLHEAVHTGDYAVYRRYAGLVNERPVATMRDLLGLRADLDPVSIADVEPIEAILPRFDSAGMSLGALSPEAHEALAEAMNRLGARSNSGEGGEDPARFGTNRVSKIKQVASGRFGVTPHYLVNAEVIQIKVAQGAKPGEGGQLPGGKVDALIARLRYSVPGVTLISPPPHHDIYSIEDLAQLIFDLKEVNPRALISVKLVAEPGVGTIAAGVAKAYADLITISGYDGGTAASPLTSIRYAGTPWELGLSETHQTLRVNGLRQKVRVQTDGGLKTGLDVVKAAILGAESFGFGTTPMVALGCKYLRICHLNNCATGVATQNRTLRDEHFIGTVEMAMNFFTFVATETREWMARLGVRTLEELIGRTDLLEVLPGTTSKHAKLRLDPVLANQHLPADLPQFCQQTRNEPFDRAELAKRMVADVLPNVEGKLGGEFTYAINNCDRSIGARLSGEVARRYGNTGMDDAVVRLSFSGTAGQSFGAFNAGGLHLVLTGDANDYVGKGMAGGKLVVRPPEGHRFRSSVTPIMGNTCLYGATGGELYAAGRAGERFAVRNSGAFAVIEGAGDHCCEYMTGGTVVVLGATGHNFGAGMTGGFAYVLDQDNSFVDRYNHQLVDIHRIRNDFMEGHRYHLRTAIEAFVAETGSNWGGELLDNFADFARMFWLVKPKAADLADLLNSVRRSPQ